MKWLAGLLIMLIGTAAIAARNPDSDLQVALMAGYGATIVAGLMAARLLWLRAARQQDRRR